VNYLVGAGRALIMSTRDSRVTVFFGNYSNKSLSIPQAKTVVGVRERAQLSFQSQPGAVNSDVLVLPIDTGGRGKQQLRNPS
jgi:hypothetical protein